MQVGAILIAIVLLTPLETLKKHNQLLEEAAKTSQDRVAERVISDMIDFKKMALRSLGKKIKLFTPSQKKRYISLFSNLLKRSSIKKLSSYQADRVEFVKENINDSKAEVLTEVWKGREVTEVVYVMEQEGKRWMITDIIIDGTSLVRNYRSQFAKVINEVGVEGLLRKMERKLREE